MSRSLVVPSSGEVKELKIPRDDEKAVNKMQDILGGYWETLGALHMTDYCVARVNEGGKTIGLPLNTRMLELFPQLPLYGDVLITYHNPDTGESMSLPPRFTTLTWRDCFQSQEPVKDIPPPAPIVLSPVAKDTGLSGKRRRLERKRSNK